MKFLQILQEESTIGMGNPAVGTREPPDNSNSIGSSRQIILRL